MPELRVLELNTLIDDAARMLRRLVGEPIDLQLRLDRSLGAVRADPSHVTPVLLNLHRRRGAETGADRRQRAVRAEAVHAEGAAAQGQRGGGGGTRGCPFRDKGNETKLVGMTGFEPATP